MEFATAPHLFIPPHRTEISVASSRARAIPPRTSALGLSYRPADAPQQIMIALISFDSRLFVLPRDIVTRQHEGQDNSQKNPLLADGTDEN